VRRSIEVKVPVGTVFTYFARPEHVSDQMTDKGVGMTVIPMDIKEGMGVGTTFRIIGDFGGKRLEWDCETTEFERERRISARQIDGASRREEKDGQRARLDGPQRHTRQARKGRDRPIVPAPLATL